MDLAPGLKLSPTEQRIYDLLADGEPHRKEEVLSVFDDELATNNQLYVTVYKLKLKLRTVGEDLIAQSFGKWVGYRRVRPIEPAKTET